MTGDRFRYILFNRDERRTRALELPPKAFRPTNAPAYLAPTDPNSGGTWIAANEYGLTAAVLNYYDAISAQPPANGLENPKTSRGTLPPAAAAHKTTSRATEAVCDLVQHQSFAPFLLLVAAANDEGALISWDGHDLRQSTLAEVTAPLTTSSWNSTEVTSFRRDLFHQTTSHPPKLHELLEFHGIHAPEKPAFAPSMIRDDATTRSMTLVRIGTENISMRHQFFAPESATYTDLSEIQINRRFSS